MIFLDVRPPQSAEDRRETAVAHLALARSLNCRNRHFGLLIEYTKDFVKNKRVLKVRKRKGAALMVAPYFVSMTDELIKTESAS